jgi:hypothetical protein
MPHPNEYEPLRRPAVLARRVAAIVELRGAVQTHWRNPFHDGLPVIEHEWCRQDVERCSAGTLCDIDRAYDLFRPSHLID